MLKPVSRRELIRKLQRIGFAGPFPGGRHQFMQRGDLRIFVPNPHGKDIGIVLLRKILKDAEISEKEFLEI